MGLGEAAMQRDGAGGQGRPPAPHRGEPGNGEPGNDDHGDEVDDAEDSNVAVAGEQERPAHGDDIESDDKEAVRHPDAIREVVRLEPHPDRTTDHRRKQRRGHHGPDPRERRHHPLPPPRRLKRDDGQRDEHGQHDEGDQQIGPERGVADPTRHMALEPQPDERLDKLVGAEQQRDPRQREEFPALVDVADSIDADRTDDQAADDVSLRREAHVASSGRRMAPGQDQRRCCFAPHRSAGRSGGRRARARWGVENLGHLSPPGPRLLRFSTTKQQSLSGPGSHALRAW